MPSGRTHLVIELALLGVYAIPLAFLALEGVLAVQEVISFALAYALSTLFLSPDLDLVRSRASRRWGAGRILWLPYSAVFRHRGLSHHLLLGPLTRIAYLGVLLAGVLVAADLLVGERTPVALPPWRLWVPVMIGLYLPNQTHILVDRLRVRRR